MELIDIENMVRGLLEKLNKANRYRWVGYYKNGVLCGVEKTMPCYESLSITLHEDKPKNKHRIDTFH